MEIRRLCTRAWKEVVLCPNVRYSVQRIHGAFWGLANLRGANACYLSNFPTPGPEAAGKTMRERLHPTSLDSQPRSIAMASKKRGGREADSSSAAAAWLSNGRK